MEPKHINPIVNGVLAVLAILGLLLLLNNASPEPKQTDLSDGEGRSCQIPL